MSNGSPRIGVLGTPTSWYFRDLQRAAEWRDWSITSIPFSGLHASIEGDAESIAVQRSRSAKKRVEEKREGTQRLEDLDGVIVRSMPPGSLEQVVFRMNALARLESLGVRVLNPPRSLEIAIDKYLALGRLKDAGLLVPDTVCCQTVDAAMEAFDRLGGDVVVKPIFGGEGRGITRVTDLAMMRRVAQTLAQLNAVIYVQRFIPHGGEDRRVLVVGDEMFVVSRHNADDWRTNVSCGGTMRPAEATDELREWAGRAVAAVGAPLLAVDFLPGNDGRFYALEVNAVPGWRALSATLDVDIAGRVLDLAVG